MPQRSVDHPQAMRDRITKVARIDLNLLTVFDVVMTERHVSRAAERLGMTQSAVSNALNRLRQLLDDPLFVKTARGVDPTPHARSLWPDIHRALEELNAILRPNEFDPACARTVFRLAMGDLAAALLTPHLFARVNGAAPFVKISAVLHDASLTPNQLMRGEVDFAVCSGPPRASILQSIPLWSEPHMLVARTGHPLLQPGTSLEAICAAQHLAVSILGNFDTSVVVDEVLSKMGLARNICLTVNQFSTAISTLRNSDLIAILPARLALVPGAQNGIRTASLPLELPRLGLFLVWHRRYNTSPAHMWFKGCIEDAVAVLNDDECRRNSALN